MSAECEDETGRCECVEGVTGDKCDVCGEGFHVIAQGCIGRSPSWLASQPTSHLIADSSSPSLPSVL